MVVTKEFLAQTRTLARDFIRASDTANALGAEWQYATATEPDEETPQNDLVNLADKSVLEAQLAAFYETLGALLGPLTDDQKKAIYALK